MNRSFAYVMSASALLAGAAGPMTPAAPGQATQARVWIQNRTIAEAVPVTVHNGADASPLRVQITGTPTVAIQRDVDNVMRTRGARQAWEYRAITVAPGQDPVAALNGAGADGWEATGMTTTARDATIVVMKRPK